MKCICQGCGKEFYRRPSDIQKLGKGKFCSKPCKSTPRKLAFGLDYSVSAEDADLLRHPWHINSKGYAVVCINAKQYRLHRLVMSRMVGRPLHKHDICDHINRLRNDNRRQNLRLVSFSENTSNRNAVDIFRHKHFKYLATRTKTYPKVIEQSCAS